MAVTRINNNQVTDAITGNAIVGINAGTKLQAYSITATRIANNLTYGSDLTITGNLTVSGTTTNVDTVNTLIQDPLITLADGQTSGAPTLDIGTIGLRGSQNSAVLAWKESALEFVTALSNTTVSNTTFNINSYANLHTGNFTVQGTTSLIGNIIGAVNATDTITGGNLATAGTASAGGNITGGNLLTGGLVSATANITGGNVLTGGQVSATGNGIFGNISTAGSFNAASLSVSGNITGGNLLTGGLISAGGNVSAGNVSGTNLTGTNVSVTGTATAASTVGGVMTGSSVSVTGTATAASTVGGVITGSSSSVTGAQTAASTVGGVITGTSTSVTGTQTAASTVGGVITGSSSSVTGTQTAASTVGGVITGSSSSVTGAQTAASTVGGVITGTSTSVTGTQTAASTVGGVITGSSASVTGNVAATSFNGNLFGSSVSVTGTVTAASTVGGVITGSSSSVTGTQTAASTVGGVITGSSVSVTGNVVAGNVITDFIFSTGNTTLTINAQTISLNPTGNVGMNSRNINNLANPSADQDAVTKIYVDTVAQGLDPKASVVYATTANLAPYTYNNGSSGVGATITLTSAGNLTIDGNIVASSDRVLIKNEVGAFVNNTTQSAAFNGIYVVTTAGAPGVAAVLTRATDFDNGSPSGEIPGAFTFVEAGTVNADTGYVCTTNNPVTVGTTQIIWVQFSGAGSFTAGNALSLNGTQFNVNVDSTANATIGINGSNQLIIPASAVLTTPNIGAATGTSVSVTGAVTAASTVGGVITGSSVSVTGTATAASTVGGVITGSSSSVTGTQTAASTVGGVITGTSVSVTGGVTAASVAGGVITGTSTSVTGTQTAASTVGGVITGSSSSVTGTQTAASTVGGVITGTSTSVTGTQTAASTVGGVITGSSSSVTGTQTAASTVGGVITGSSVSVTGNVNAGNTNSNVFGTTVSVTGTVTAASTVGGVITGSSVSVTGTQTAASTVGGVITGSSVSVTGNVVAGNVQTGGLISATGNVTSGNVLTGGLVSATANVTGGNLLTGGLISATANITGNNVVGTTSGQFGNIVISGDDITDTNGRVNINTAGADVDFAVNGDTVANVFYVDAGTGTASFGSSTQTTNALVAFNATSSILLPAGNLVQRPATGVSGMMRFNSTSNSLEIYNNTAWTSVGATVFTVITDQQFNGDGVNVAFTLANASTTASTIVSINGVLQIPTSAYSVANVTLTFTEAPASGDLIDVRALTTTSTVLSIQNVSGNASVGVSDTSKTVAITGDLTVSGNATVLGNVGTNLILNGSSRIEIPDANGNIHFDINSANDIFNIGQFNCVFNSNASPAANVTYDLGTTTKRWKDLYLAGNSIVLGNTVIKNTSGNSIGFFGPDGSTAATIDAASVDTTQIASGTSNVRVVSSGGNVTTSVGGTSNVAVFATTGAFVTGVVSASGNVTGGNILTSGLISATGTITGANITGSNILTGGLISATGGVTAASVAGGVITGSSASVTGTVTGASVVGGVITGTSVSVTGNITGGNVLGGANVNATTHTGTTASLSGNVTGGNLITAGTLTVNSGAAATAIINGAGNAIGNIGSSSNYFNTVFAKATSAQYADLAEKYTADAEYAAGTVVVFGGTAEVTVNTVAGDTKVAGVVSTNPSYTMNSGLESEHVATVALTGRVPTMVIGPVRKGDLMVAAGLGRAQSSVDPKVGSVIGKALEDFDGAEGTIEVVVGRF